MMDLLDYQKMLYKNLAGGLKQRVGVAISLVNDPEIVFLDEPTTGLDPKARREVWNVISGLKKQGKTVFLTTHYMEEAEYLADHIAIIHKRKIIAEGSLDDLIQKYETGAVLHIKKCSDNNAAEILKEKGFIAESEEDNGISVKIDSKERVLEVLAELKHACIDYDSIDIKRTNLEKVFLNLTGAKLMEENT
jgi:ABC-2 type transport system ATP-binding protein